MINNIAIELYSFIVFFLRRGIQFSLGNSPRDCFFLCSDFTFQYLKCLFVFVYLLFFPLLLDCEIIEYED